MGFWDEPHKEQLKKITPMQREIGRAFLDVYACRLQNRWNEDVTLAEKSFVLAVTTNLLGLDFRHLIEYACCALERMQAKASFQTEDAEGQMETLQAFAPHLAKWTHCKECGCWSGGTMHGMACSVGKKLERWV